MSKLLALDVETAPAKCWVWGLHEQNIGIEQIIEPSRIICWSAKWLGEKRVYYADERSGAKKMFREMHSLLSEADALITYNGDSFDLQKLNGEFVYHQIPPAPPVTSIDLYKTVRNLGYISGKLAFIGPFLKVGDKVKHEGFSLWAGCLRGDKDCWSRMKAYNMGDTVLLEGLYNVLKPYIRNHPAVNIGGCPVCGSDKIQARGNRRTKGMLIQRIHCQSCGAWSDGKRSYLRAA